MQEEVKGLYKELETCTNNDERLRIMFDIATNLLNFDQKRALEVADEIKAFADEIDNNIGRVYYHSTRGRVFFKKSMYQDCEQEFKEALRISLFTTSMLDQAMCHDSLGILCTYLNRHDDALLACQEALVIYKQINTRPAFRYQVVCYNNIGVTYRKMYQCDKALEAFVCALQLLDEFEVGTMRYTVLNNVAKIKLANGHSEEAFTLANEAMQGFKLAKHKNGMANTGVTIASYYLNAGNFASAHTQFLSVLKLCKAIDNKVAEIAAYRGLGEAYVKMEAFDQAHQHFEKAQVLAMSAGDDQELCEVYLAQAKAYIAQQRIDLAAGKYKLGLDLTKKRKLPQMHAVFEDLHGNLSI
jgi:tetratricopeptide (TPR) repeat protein